MIKVKNKITGTTMLEIKDLSRAYLFGADLSGADLSRADLSRADLSMITLCKSTIDGAKLRSEDIGGPGNILCALTQNEWNLIKEGRKKGHI